MKLDTAHFVERKMKSAYNRQERKTFKRSGERQEETPMKILLVTTGKTRTKTRIRTRVRTRQEQEQEQGKEPEQE